MLGEKKEEALVKQIPKRVRYVGVGVGKRWSRQFMKSAAGRTGGLFTQINPDEKVGWRAFELLSTLNAPRLLDVRVTDEGEKLKFLNFADSLAQGEEFCAITRTEAGAAMPKTLIVTGTLDGKPYKRKIAVTADPIFDRHLILAGTTVPERALEVPVHAGLGPSGTGNELDVLGRA